MNEIIPFGYGDNLVRVVQTENGEPMWVAKDICDILGISKYRDAVAKLDDDEGCPLKVDTLGGTQEMICINESGLYTLILRSNKPEAKPFKKWVTHEVLPSIRKTGGYNMGGSATSIDYAPVLTEVKNFLVGLEAKLDVQKEETNNALALITKEIEEYKFFSMNMKSAVQGSVLKVEKYQEDVIKTISDTYNYLKYQPMSREERQRIALRVTARAKAIALESGIAEPEATKRVYQELCKAFKIKTYHDLERSKFAMAYEFIPEITIEGGYCLPPLEVKDDFEKRWGIDKNEGSRGKTVWGDTPDFEVI
jgi:prophage antirepressor-like protein